MADFARAVEHVPEWPTAAPGAAAAGPDPSPAGFAAPAASQHPVWGAARGGNAARTSLLLVLLRAEAERLAVRLVCPSPKVSHFSQGCFASWCRHALGLNAAARRRRGLR